ncbi:MAG: TetR/AcrR family transcriptional regulator [Tessaracoccus sp.]|uniref:TetR/AcrR family transcriptional regulator n=1 Tax=Tessaracoccus sp. TaxID=1971211 RepID=UPI001EC9F890|nr:TetR/AcrR family transcriptional regulator [Tessaracoccus sp.]MBK7821724.1 TetR/AcrR family transcriptional regulator [Tessaracoccus sp.]
MAVDDRTAKARLRDTAVEIVAEEGARALTARGVADRAGLSAGLIRHHFGSMADLLVACDEHVAATIKQLKEEAIQGGPSVDVLAAVRQSGDTHIMGYLAMRLADDSRHINDLVDALAADAAEYMADGVELGLFTRTPNERRRAAMMTIYALGSLVMYRHMRRLLGVDIRAVDLAAQPGFGDYVRLQMEVFSGLVTPAVLDQYAAALAHLQEEEK